MPKTANALGQTLLVVDDDPADRDMLSRRLERPGYRVVLAEDGKQALEFIRQYPCDLILLDHMMPGLSGLETLRLLRETRPAAELPVIMVTARSQSKAIVEALSLGANDYVTKPLDFPVVLARIRNHLAQKKALDTLRASEQHLTQVAKGSGDGLWDWDLSAGQIYFSSRWKEMLGYDQVEIGNDIEEWFSRVHPGDLGRLQAELEAHRDGLTPRFENEHRMLHRDGGSRWMLARGLAVGDENGRAIRMAGSQTDITQSKIADPLTGLPNRILFCDRLTRSLERARHQPGYHFAVLLLDLDRIQLVGGSLGPEARNELLIGVADRLLSGLRVRDTVARLNAYSTVAHLDGDEFGVLLDDIRQPEDAARIAERIQSTLALPFCLSGQEVFASAVVGLTVNSSAYQSPYELLRDASTARNRAKAQGKSRIEIFDSGTRDCAAQRLQLEADLRNAWERQEFELYYQALVALESGRIAGFEALVRWRHPQRGLVGPVDFIPLAEETGLIVPLGRWVLEQACLQVQAWKALPGTTPDLIMSVNVSGKQFLQPNLVEQIVGVLEQTGLPPASLKLEITESTVMQTGADAATMLARLKDSHIGISLDDFGTGYSSLSYLHRFPIDTLKIDRSFIGRLDQTRENTGIIKAIVMLARDLGLKVVAEGVETAEQLSILRTLGCEYAQGYLFSRPIDSAAATQLLESKPRW